MTTPAEQLRAAATKLRETASKATPGPWRNTVDQYVSAGSDGDWCLVVTNPTTQVNAAWIALASPALAEPLAAWLEAEAEHAEKGIVRDTPECPACGEGCRGHDEQDFHDGTDDRLGCNRPLGGPDDHRCGCFDRSLAVARAVNRSTS